MSIVAVPRTSREVPAVEEGRELLETLLRDVGPDESYRLLHQFRSALGSGRTDPVGANDPIRELVAGPLTEEERARIMFEGLMRSFLLRRELISESLSTRQAAELLGLSSRQAPLDRREQGKLLGVQDNDEWRFPMWQFDSTAPSGVIAGLVEVLEVLLGREPLWQLMWLATPKRGLEGRRPYEALREGQLGAVLDQARAAITE